MVPLRVQNSSIIYKEYSRPVIVELIVWKSFRAQIKIQFSNGRGESSWQEGCLHLMDVTGGGSGSSERSLPTQQYNFNHRHTRNNKHAIQLALLPAQYATLFCIIR